MMQREEIIKALRCCWIRPDLRDCEEKCPYFCGINLSRCIPNMISDAITLLEADTTNIAMLQAENERIRQNSVSQEVYQMMCEERDAAVNDLSLTNTRKFNNPCEICKHNGEKCEPVDLQSVCYKWEWRGPQKGGKK